MAATEAFGGRIRVAALQYFIRPVRAFEDFEAQVEGLVDTSADYRGQLVVFPAGSVVGPDEMRGKGLIRKRGIVKCLAEGTLGHALTVKAHAFSAKARDAITTAGGTAEVLGA